MATIEMSPNHPKENIMNWSFSKTGGLIVNTKKMHLCIYPANVRFAKGHNTIVAFGIGFTINHN